MAAKWQYDAGGQWAEKAASSAMDFVVSFADQLDTADTIQSATWSGDSGVMLGHTSATENSATAWISGGVGGNWYMVTVTAVTAAGQTLVKAFRVYVADGATLGVGIVSCFPSLVGAIASIRRDRLLSVAQTYCPGVQIDDDYILEKLVAAEADAQRRLRCFFTPREIVPDGTSQDVIAALQAAGNTVVIEPGYDYTPDFFQGDTWGRIDVRHRPIIAVHSIQFAYPTPQLAVYTIPIEWVRLDRKYGSINLVPIETALMLPLNAFILSALGGGGTVPLMLQVAYRAGLPNAAGDYPDLLNVIKKMAVLDIIGDQFNPSSRSDSADGLSQSLSVDMDKLGTDIDKRLDVLRRSIQGIQIGFG